MAGSSYKYLTLECICDIKQGKTTQFLTIDFAVTQI